jgi:hypothetical protein
MIKVLSILSLIISFNSPAEQLSGFEIDTQELHKDLKIQLISGKKGGVRLYQGSLNKTFNQSVNAVMNSIINFEEKCNNDLKDRRKFQDKKKECPYHNANLIESKIYREINKNYSKENDEVDRFLVARRIYNRQDFSHMDLVKVYEKKNAEGKKIVIIRQDMISDKDVKNYMKPPVELSSVFSRAYSEFILTENNDKSTEVNFIYVSETDHWLLNKSVSISKVFDSMAKSIDLLMLSIQKELARVGDNSKLSQSIASN